jgi:hypothetical protein
MKKKLEQTSKYFEFKKPHRRAEQNGVFKIDDKEN